MYLDSARYYCKTHKHYHDTSAHSAIISANHTVSVDLIKVNNNFLSENALNFFLHLYKDEACYNIASLRRKYLTCITSNLTRKIKLYQQLLFFYFLNLFSFQNIKKQVRVKNIKTKLLGTNT